MSTRSTCHFHWSSKSQGAKPDAIIYRHADGYPSVAGQDIFRFLKRCAALKDSRLGDPPYLAARYVAFLGEKFAWGYSGGERQKAEDPIDFTSVGVCQKDPGDIDYRYHVWCADTDEETELPLVTVEKVAYSGSNRELPREELYEHFPDNSQTS